MITSTKMTGKLIIGATLYIKNSAEGDAYKDPQIFSLKLFQPLVNKDTTMCQHCFRLR